MGVGCYCILVVFVFICVDCSWAQPNITTSNGDIQLRLTGGSALIQSQSINDVNGSITTSTSPIVTEEEVQALISAAVVPLLSRLQMERSRAQQAERNLNVTLAFLTSMLTAAESSRAIAAEASIMNIVGYEMSRASAAEAADASTAAALTMQRTSQGESLVAIANAETSRASTIEGSLASGVMNEVSRAMFAESSLSSSFVGAFSSGTISEQNRAGGVESSIASAVLAARSRAIAAEFSLSSSLGVAISSSVTSEISRALFVEGSVGSSIAKERSRVISFESSIALAITSTNSAGISAAQAEKSRSSNIEGIIAQSVFNEASRAKIAEQSEASRATATESSLSLSVSPAQSSVQLEASRATLVDTSLALSVSIEVSRAQIVEASIASVNSRTVASISSSVASVASSAVSTAASMARVLANISSPQYAANTFLCIPGTWSTQISGAVSGCSSTFYVTSPTLVVAMFNGHCQVSSGWLYVGISINNDFPLTSDPGSLPMASGAAYAPSHSYATIYENTRTARAVYVPAYTTVTVQVKFLSNAANAYCNGHALQGFYYSESTLGSLPRTNRITRANTFGCTYSVWSFPMLTAASNYVMCLSTLTTTYPAIVWGFFGGHEIQSAGSIYGFLSIDNDATGPLVDYTTVNSVYTQLTGANWDGFNTARVKAVTTGPHTISPSFYTLAGTTGASFNGGGMFGLYIPTDPKVANQVFRCSANSAVTISTAPTLVCTVSVTLPYRAVVWAEFTGAARVSSGWLYGSVDFDGDTIALFTSAPNNNAFMTLGAAHTYATIYKPFGNGRSVVLSAGSHTISIYGRASVGGLIQGAALDGFFLPN